MISEKVQALLEDNEFFLGNVEKQGNEFYAEVNHTSPAGEDFWVTIWYDGTTEGFIRRFTECTREFSVDEHVSLYAGNLGKHGVPESYKELVEDAEAIRSELLNMAGILNGEDVADEPVLYTMLELSTAHLRPETMAMLEKGEFDWLPSFRKPIPGDDEHSYGAFVCIGDIGREERGERPADLAQIWDFCYLNDIWWVMFDRDAPMCSRFTDFTPEWEKEEQA